MFNSELGSEGFPECLNGFPPVLYFTFEKGNDSD